MTTLTLRQTLTLIALFVATSAFFIILDDRNVLDPVKTGLLDVVQPISRGIREIADGPDNDSDLAQENQQLRDQNAALQATIVAMTDDVQETEQLRQQLEVQEDHPDWEMVTARVINRDPAGDQKLIIIDKGSADGIKKGMPVVDPLFYVGIVTHVEEHSAEITLSIDASQQVGARIVNGGDGIAVGDWQNGGRMELQHVDRDQEVKEGDYVVTADRDSSARTALVPPELPIGTVMGEPVRDEQTDTLTIEVLPFCDFEELKVVSIIVNGGG